MVHAIAFAYATDVVDVAGGSGLMGDGNSPDAPRRTVTLSPFRIDRTEVSIASFERFAREGWRARENWSESGWVWAQNQSPQERSELRSASEAGLEGVLKTFLDRLELRLQAKSDIDGSLWEWTGHEWQIKTKNKRQAEKIIPFSQDSFLVHRNTEKPRRSKSPKMCNTCVVCRWEV